ncbi:MAG: hydrogenase maturation nickel metallochaperone HypA [Desulfobulbaceae bacterium]|nr:hydrogenase maturation nickel metallochaperone HypA [Desulfobulbaceae bacterium]
MHEFSLAQGLHSQLLDLVREHDMVRVKKAIVLIGENAGIVVDSFVFGVNVLLEQYPETKGMELVIEHDNGQDLILQSLELE